MVDKSCFSCFFARYEDNKTGDGNYIVCSKEYEITANMVIDNPCKDYIRRTIKWGNLD